MVKLVYGLWDTSAACTNTVVKDFILTLDKSTKMLVDISFTDPDADALLQSLAGIEDATHAVLIKGGAFVYGSFCEDLEAQCANPFYASGYVVAEGNAFPFIDDRILLVNLTSYRASNMPKITLAAGTSDTVGGTAQLSPDFVNNNPRLPEWVGQSDTKTPLAEVVDKFAQGLILAAFAAGERVTQIPASFFFAYVHTDISQTDDSEAVINGLRSGVRPVQFKNLLAMERAVFERIYKINKNPPVFVFSSEGLASGLPTTDQFDAIAAPATGFKPLALWVAHGKPATAITIYDSNQKALDFWKHVIEQWDGVSDFQEFTTAYDDAVANEARYIVGTGFATEIADLLSYFGGQDAFSTAWTAFKALEPNYLLVDLLANSEPLTATMCDGANLISFSNLFAYVPTLRLHGETAVNASYAAFVSEVKGVSADAVLLGVKPTLDGLVAGPASDIV